MTLNIKDMKFTNLIFAFALTAALVSCAGNGGKNASRVYQPADSTVISGNFGSDVQQVRVATSSGYDQIIKLEEGVFNLTIPTEVASYALVMDLGGQFGTYFVPDGTELKVSVVEEDLVIESSQDGPTAAYMKYKDSVKDLETEEEYYPFIKEIVEANPANGAALLVMATNAPYVCTPDQLSELIALLESPVAENEMIVAISGSLQAKINTAEGKKFVDFTVEHVYGYDRSIDPQPLKKEVKFSDYVGKGTYVLVDFWSPWCGPCRAEVPNIQKVYQQYKDKGLEVLSLAVWERKPQFHTIETAADLGMDWLHINNCGTVPTDIYGVDGIPHLMLIGPDGTILKRGFHGLEGIQAAVAEYIK